MNDDRTCVWMNIVRHLKLKVTEQQTNGNDYWLKTKIASYLLNTQHTTRPSVCRRHYTLDKETKQRMSLLLKITLILHTHNRTETKRQILNMLQNLSKYEKHSHIHTYTRVRTYAHSQ